jgi:hypothetical protein
LAKAIREQTPNAEDRVRSMSGGEVLGTALIAWLRDGDDSLEVSQKVVEMVWPRACAGWPQTYHMLNWQRSVFWYVVYAVQPGSTGT